VSNRAARAAGGLLLLPGVFLLLVTLMDGFGPGAVHPWLLVVSVPLLVVGGWLLQRGVEPPSYSSTPACPGCGRRSQGDARFCSACGSELG
jgi:hypothetical protein